MKTIMYSLFAPLLLLLTACGGVEGDNSTPAELGRLIFNSLKHNKPEVYGRYICSTEDVQEILDGFEGTPEEKAIFVRYEVEDHQETYGRIKEAFSKIRQRAEEKGITDWDKFEFKRTTFKKAETPWANYAHHVHIEFASEDYTGQVGSFKMMETKRGWVIVTVPEFKFLRPNNLLNRG